jgi:hypothetical protein
MSHRTDGARGRFSPGTMCRSMNRLVSSPRLLSASKARHLARDVLRHVARPALGVEGDHAKRVRILATQEIADDRFGISLGGVGLVIGDAVVPVLIQDPVDGDIVRRLKHAAGHSTHSQQGTRIQLRPVGAIARHCDDSTGWWRAAISPECSRAVSALPPELMEHGAVASAC